MSNGAGGGSAPRRRFGSGTRGPPASSTTSRSDHHLPVLPSLAVRASSSSGTSGGGHGGSSPSSSARNLLRHPAAAASSPSVITAAASSVGSHQQQQRHRSSDDDDEVLHPLRRAVSAPNSTALVGSMDGDAAHGSRGAAAEFDLEQLLMRARSPSPVAEHGRSDDDADDANRTATPPSALRVVPAPGLVDEAPHNYDDDDSTTPLPARKSGGASGGGGRSVDDLTPARPAPMAAMGGQGSDDDLDVPPDLRCPVCLDVFSDPVTLQCYHNVCHRHVLDLAAARGKRRDDPSGATLVECPKCRETTTFPDGPSSVRVNTEMKAIVQMMVQMLRKNTSTSGSGQGSSTAGSPTAHHQPASARSGRTRSRGSSKNASRATSQDSTHSGGRTPGRVRFVLDDDDDDDEDTTPAPAAVSTTSGDEAAEARAPAVRSALQQRRTPQRDGGRGGSSRHQESNHHQRLADIEKDLEAKRQQMVLERERRHREAIDQYKQQRLQEIRSRQAVEAAIEQDTLDNPDDPLLRKPVAIRMHEGEDVPAEERIETHEERKWRVQEAAFRAAKRHFDERREKERETREAEVRQALDDWLHDAPKEKDFDAERETEAFAERMQAAMSGSTRLTDSVKRDAMRQAAEARLPPPPSPPPAVPSREGLTPTAQRLLDAPMRDIEVELRMLEAERAVQREVDDDLSRAEMAAIAERRARATVEQFRRKERTNQPWSRPTTGSYESPPPPGSAGKPGYQTKMSRMRRFV